MKGKFFKLSFFVLSSGHWPLSIPTIPTEPRVSKKGSFAKWQSLVVNMIKKSPSGALSPYYYKGGYFHGIHYGSYFDDANALLSMMDQEANYILSSSEKRRIMIDLYETRLSDAVMEKIVEHIGKLSPRIIKLAIASDKKSLRKLQKAISNRTPLGKGQLYFSTDMEEAKTWLVTD